MSLLLTSAILITFCTSLILCNGGATIPRGTSLVGMDLRRTRLHPLYVPDPADSDIPRTTLFNVTGGCYFWQFTILDGDVEA